jgi:hypothetical protein
MRKAGLRSTVENWSTERTPGRSSLGFCHGYVLSYWQKLHSPADRSLLQKRGNGPYVDAGRVAGSAPSPPSTAVEILLIFD